MNIRSFSNIGTLWRSSALASPRDWWWCLLGCCTSSQPPPPRYFAGWFLKMLMTVSGLCGSIVASLL